MKARNADSRRRLAVAAGAWAVLIGFLIAAGASLGGLAIADVLETAVLGGLGAAICIWFFAGDILAVADRLHWPRRPTRSKRHPDVLISARLEEAPHFSGKVS